jgi:hypothetical protein
MHIREYTLQKKTETTLGFGELADKDQKNL